LLPALLGKTYTKISYLALITTASFLKQKISLFWKKLIACSAWQKNFRFKSVQDIGTGSGGTATAQHKNASIDFGELAEIWCLSLDEFCQIQRLAMEMQYIRSSDGVSSISSRRLEEINGFARTNS
jgi:hypothetical protein